MSKNKRPASSPPLRRKRRPGPSGGRGSSGSLQRQALDRKYRHLSASAALEAPVHALFGVSTADAKALEAALGVRTIRELATHPAITAATAMVAGPSAALSSRLSELTPEAPAGSALPAGSLAPVDDSSHQQVGSSYALITAHAEAIKNQAPFASEILEAAPQLNDHLAQLQGLADTWLVTHQVQVLDTLELPIAYNTKFQSFYGTLSQLAGTMGPDNNDAAQFSKGLGLLIQAIDATADSINSTYSDLTAYRSGLESSVRQFGGDLTSAQSYLGSIDVQQTGAVLFTAPATLVTALSAGQVPDGLRDAFKSSGNELKGALVLNEQKTGSEWALSCVQYGSDGSYLTQKAYVIGLDQAASLLNVYQGESGAISQLQARYRADQSAMRVDLALEVGGPLVAFGGLCLIVVGTVAELPSAGASTALVAAGVVVFVGGLTGATLGSLDYMKKSADSSQCLINLGQDEHLLAVLPHQIELAQGVVDHVGEAEAALSSLITAWTDYSNRMKALQAAMGQISPADGPFLQSELDTAKDDWSAVAGKATNILNNLQNRPATVVLPAGTPISVDDPAVQSAISAWSVQQPALATA